MKSIRVAGAAALALLIAVSARAAGDNDPAGARTLHDYVLSMDKIKRYDAAMQAMMAAGQTDPSLKAEGDKMGSEPDSTLADVEARFDHHPRLSAFFTFVGSYWFSTDSPTLASLKRSSTSLVETELKPI